MRTLLAFTLLGVSALAAPVPKELKRSKIDGPWKVESLQLFGNAPAFDENDCYWTIGEDGALTRRGILNKDVPVASTVRLTFDFATNDFEYRDPSTVFLGKFELSGDTLKLCLAKQGGERPSAVAPGASTYLWTLKRLTVDMKK